MNKIRTNKKNIMHILFTGLISACIFWMFLYKEDIVPFGENTFLMYDMKRQYVDFYSYLKSIVFGSNNIFYSFSTTLGFGFTGFYVYYLSSPLLILTLFFPQETLPVAISLIIGIKIVLGACFMDFFLQKKVIFNSNDHFWGHKSIACFVGAFSWAFSGYMISQSMNTMWIDVVILLPILILSLERLLDDGKRIYYICVLTLMLWCNYYLSYQVLIFVFLWTLFNIFTKHYEKPIKKLLDVLSSSVISGLNLAIVFVPVLFELGNSPKDIVKEGLAVTIDKLNILDLLSETASLVYEKNDVFWGAPQIYCGILLFFLNMLFFLNRKIAIRQKVGYGAIIFIFMASFFSDILNLFWHAGMEPSGYPYREAFLLVFVFIIIATENVVNIDGISFLQILIAAVINILVFAVVFFFNNKLAYGNAIRFNFAILLIYIILNLLMYHTSKRDNSIALIFAFTVMLVHLIDMFANSAYIYEKQALGCEKYSSYKEFVKSTSTDVNYIKKSDKSFYRVENIHPREQNDALAFNYKGITHYSSSGPTYVRDFLNKMGLNDDGLYTDFGHDSTVTLDSILGVKYLISDGVYGVANGFMQEEGNVYANPYAFSAAISVKDFDIEEKSSNVNPFFYEEMVLSDIKGAKSNVFEYIDYSLNEYFFDDELIAEYVIKPTINGDLYFYIDGLDQNLNQNFSVYVNEKLISSYGNKSCTHILNLGNVNADTEINIKVHANSSEADFGKPIFAIENIENLANIYDEIKDRFIDIDMISSSHLRFVSNKGDGVFLSVPYEKGWNIKVDGKKVKPICVYDALIYIPLESEGVHEIEMNFVPSGFVIGAIISLFSIIVTLIIALTNYGLKVKIFLFNKLKRK